MRLRQGLFDEVNVYSDTPADVAELWAMQGASFLHLVDLDGALAGNRVNESTIRQIAARLGKRGIPIQLGGGIRSLNDIDTVLGYGIYRVIIGTKAVEEPEFVRRAILAFGKERLAVGVDVKDGKVATHGWESVSQYPALEFCRMMADMGVKTIVYTDISRDGMLAGPNLAQTREISEETGVDVIASGGVSSLKDLNEISQAGIHGAIIGKALYEKRIDLREAVRMFEGRTI